MPIEAGSAKGGTGLAGAIATEMRRRESKFKLSFGAHFIDSLAIHVVDAIETAVGEGGSGVTDHGALTGLADDDHTQYHTDTRGDARYHQQTEFKDTSAGAGDAGKPVKLNGAGVIDGTMINPATVDHGGLLGLADDDHSQYLLESGARGLGGNWSLGGNDLTDPALIGGVDLVKLNAFFNGTFQQSFDALVTSDGATITLSIEQAGGGDLTMQFSDGYSNLDCTPTCTITLTAGTDQSPQPNFIYVPQSTKVLTKSTSGFPATEHIKVGYFLVPSATFVQANGCYVNQNWNDHLSGTDNQGHMAHMAEKVRRIGSSYFSGVNANGATASYFTIGVGDVRWLSTSGTIYQMHLQTFPTEDTSAGDTLLVRNWSGDPWHDLSNLYDITADSTGSAIGTNQYFNLIFWGVANKTGQFSTVVINLPSGTYNNLQNAQDDINGYDDYTIPREFSLDSSTGFLICRATLRKTASSWTHHATVDLRGRTPANAAGAGTNDHGGLGGLLDDDHAQYLLASDATDRATFAANWEDLTDGGATTLHTHSDAIHDNIAGEIKAIASKITPVGDDLLLIEDSAGAVYDKKRIAITGLAGALDHGGLLGLSDDDHTQYHNDTRGDARYYTQSQVDTSLAGKASTNHDATHIDGGSDAIDADKLEVTFTPSTYSRTLSAGQSDALDQLTSHLKGIDNEFGNYEFALINDDEFGTAGALPIFADAGGTLIYNSEVIAADLVAGPSSVTSGRVAQFNGTSGKLISDAGYAASQVNYMSGSGTDNNVPRFHGSGRVLQTSGVDIDDNEVLSGHWNAIYRRSYATALSSASTTWVNHNYVAYSNTSGANDWKCTVCFEYSRTVKTDRIYVQVLYNCTDTIGTGGSQLWVGYMPESNTAGSGFYQPMTVTRCFSVSTTSTRYIVLRFYRSTGSGTVYMDDSEVMVERVSF
jgi:hypothetical protein